MRTRTLKQKCIQCLYYHNSHALQRHQLFVQEAKFKLYFSTRESPWTVLQLETNATKQNIKDAFRKLVKQYHPDLNPSIDLVLSTAKMTEITEAYDHLMNDDYSNRWGDNSIAFACDLYSLGELKSMSLVYQVYAIEILYDITSYDKDRGAPSLDVINGKSIAKDLQCESRFSIHTDPNDSVADLKRLIQTFKSSEWGIQGRPLDRDKLAKGWELCIENTGGDDASTTLTVLSYHLFLHSYNIRHGSVVYAVIQKI